jgi:hypothetical protein
MRYAVLLPLSSSIGNSGSERFPADKPLFFVANQGAVLAGVPCLFWLER